MDHVQSPLIGTGRAIQDIAAWRNHVDDFFRTQGEKLRTLMLELEEQTWDAPESGNDLHDSDNPPRRNERCRSEQESATDPLPARDRLADLAGRLSQRLQSAAPHAEQRP